MFFDTIETFLLNFFAYLFCLSVLFNVLLKFFAKIFA